MPKKKFRLLFHRGVQRRLSHTYFGLFICSLRLFLYVVWHLRVGQISIVVEVPVFQYLVNHFWKLNTPSYIKYRADGMAWVPIPHHMSFVWGIPQLCGISAKIVGNATHLCFACCAPKEESSYTNRSTLQVKVYFSNSLYRIVVWELAVNCCQVNVAESH